MKFILTEVSIQLYVYVLNTIIELAKEYYFDCFTEYLYINM